MHRDLLAELPDGSNRTAILECLSRVLDPELDEPILQLGLVQSLAVRDGHATVTLQLPTSWCAINFAFMMAEDVRTALLSVRGIEGVTVRMGDHCSAPEIEAAVNSGKPFTAAFGDEGKAGLVALRALFLRKGFLARQERLLRELRAASLSDATIAAQRAGDAARLESAGAASNGSLQRYLTRRGELGLDCSPETALIVDQRGDAVPAERLEAYYQQIRTIRVSMEANGSFCRAVLATRGAAS